MKHPDKKQKLPRCCKCKRTGQQFYQIESIEVEEDLCRSRILHYTTPTGLRIFLLGDDSTKGGLACKQCLTDYRKHCDAEHKQNLEDYLTMFEANKHSIWRRNSGRPVLRKRRKEVEKELRALTDNSFPAKPKSKRDLGNRRGA